MSGMRGRWRARAFLAYTWVNVGLWVACSTEGGLVALLGRPWDWAEFLVRFLVLGAVGQPLLWWVGQRLDRRAGQVDPEQQHRDAALDLTSRSVWAGRLDAHVDPAAWAAALQLVGKELRTVLVLTVAASGSALGLLAAAAVRTGPGSAGIWAIAAGVAVLGMPLLLLLLRLQRNRGRLADEVDRRSTTAGAPGHSTP